VGFRWRHSQTVVWSWHLEDRRDEAATQKSDIKNRPFSFAYQIMNKQAFETSYSQQGSDAGKATVVPMRRDSFILLSPGRMPFLAPVTTL